MANQKSGWTTFAGFVLLVVLVGGGILLSTLTGMSGRLVGVLEGLAIAMLVFLYAGYLKYIRPHFARSKNTGEIPPPGATL